MNARFRGAIESENSSSSRRIGSFDHTLCKGNISVNEKGASAVIKKDTIVCVLEDEMGRVPLEGVATAVENTFTKASTSNSSCSSNDNLLERGKISISNAVENHNVSSSSCAEPMSAPNLLIVPYERTSYLREPDDLLEKRDDVLSNRSRETFPDATFSQKEKRYFFKDFLHNIPSHLFTNSNAELFKDEFHDEAVCSKKSPRSYNSYSSGGLSSLERGCFSED